MAKVLNGLNNNNEQFKKRGAVKPLPTTPVLQQQPVHQMQTKQKPQQQRKVLPSLPTQSLVKKQTPPVTHQQQPRQTESVPAYNTEWVFANQADQQRYEQEKANPHQFENAWHTKAKTERRAGKSIYDVICHWFPEAKSQMIAKSQANGRTVDYTQIEKKYLNLTMIEAAKRGNLPVLKWCVDVGGDLGYVREGGSNVLIAAAIQDRTDIIEYLGKLNLNPNRWCKRSSINSIMDTSRYCTALTQAGLHKNISAIKALVSIGAYLSGYDDMGDTVIHSLAYSKSLDAIAQLIEVYDPKQDRLPNELFNFHKVNNQKKNTLAVVYHVMSALHIDFFYDAREQDPTLETADIIRKAKGADLNDLLQRMLKLCSRIEDISQLSAVSGDIDTENNIASRLPIEAYSEEGDFSKLAKYVGDLYRADSSYILKLYLRASKHTAIDALNTFRAAVEQAEFDSQKTLCKVT